MILDKEFPLSSKNTKDILNVNHISETIDTLISVIDNVTIEGIFISDNQRKCIQANNIAANIFGYTKDEMIGLEISQLVAPESQELIKAANHEVFWAILNTFKSRKKIDERALNRTIVSRLQKLLYAQTGRRPVIIPMVTIINNEEKQAAKQKLDN